MNKKQASDIIQKTFPEAFDKGRFRNFVINVLNRLDESKAQHWSTQYVKDAFKGHVRRYERLGTYTSPDRETLDVLIVYLTANSKLERARTAIRNFVADHLKKRNEKDAALVAFVSPTEMQWRFSYVKMEYATIEKESGNIGVETRLTPARRFSYLVGDGESCHTAQTRFLGLLQETESDPTLARIEEAFSVEAVTKEFFAKYAELFGDITVAVDELVKKAKILHDEFKAKGVNTVDFAKKLMGQIVFLYFLQKKGWLGVEKGKDWGTGPRDFLRRLADGDHGKHENFFNDILEPLFYDTLATDRGHEAWCKHFKCRIPFLNGGLFEPLGDYDWKKTDIILPNRLFRNNDFVEEGLTGTGVLDVFDRYNFTVNEAEPLEIEVAIDPEMLGKVFENLIEANRRKGLGSYYTPREIVHYMCQESLINYLDTSINTSSESLIPQKAKQTKLFGDPEPEQATLKTTVHREVVPRAEIETFVRLGEQISHYEAVDTRYAIKMPKSIKKNARALDDALKTITVCDPAVGSGAFPVGMMTEIVRARTALTPYFNDVEERTAYHFKRHAIQNCLYGVDIDSSAVDIAKLRLWLSLVVDEEDSKQIKPLPNLDYKVVTGNSLYTLPFKSQGLLAIEEIKRRFFDETDHDRKADLKAQIDERIGRLLAASKKSLGYHVKFDFTLYFSEVFDGPQNGFDIVIGNPPYLNVQLVSPKDKEYFANVYRTFYKRFDVFGLFFELGLTRLVQNGTVAFIVPQQIFNNLSYKKLRNLILSNKWLHEVLYLGDKIFESANNDVCILFLWKPSVEEIRLVNALDFHNRTTTIVATNYFEKYDNVISVSADSSSDGIFDKLFDPKWERVRDRFDVFQGIVTGNNTAFLPSDTQVRSAHIEKPLLYPVLLGRDFEKWRIRSKDRRILYVNKFINIGEYPKAEKWLEQFKVALKKRRECQRGVIPWYSLQWPREKKKLDHTPKLMVQRTRNPRLRTRIVAMVDEEGLYGMESIIFVLPKISTAPTYYLLGILNSSLINYLYATKFLNVAVKAEYLKDTPIPKADRAQEKLLTGLVKNILAAKRRNPEADMTDQEKKIDHLVYDLYGLTPEEIKIVEAGA